MAVVISATHRKVFHVALVVTYALVLTRVQDSFGAFITVWALWTAPFLAGERFVWDHTT